MPISQEEQRNRWKAGLQDINDDGVVDLSDIVTAAYYASQSEMTKEEKVESVSGAVGTIMGGGGGLDVEAEETKLGDYKIGLQEFKASDLDPSKLSANPMPSLPSISNVGAAPFSGSINWSAIPGGFQPLPQVAGGRKKLYQLSKFHGGINQKSSPRDIADMECQEATNVTFSQVGRIKMLGDIKSTSSGISLATLASSATHIPSPGYGLFIFKSGYSIADIPVQGNFTIAASTDGEHVVVNDGSTAKTGADEWLTISNAATHVAPVFYAAGSGLYVCDANLLHTVSRKVAMLVHRKDYDSATPANAANLITKSWIYGSQSEALIKSPIYDTAATDGSVNLEWQDEMSSAFTATTVVGSATVHIGSSGTGTWDGDYFFYISWLFDNGCETGLTSLVTTGASAPNGPFTFESQILNFNFSVQDDNSSRNYIGNEARIDGARIYFRESGTVERWMLAEISLFDGIKGALDSTFTKWHEPATDRFDLEVNMTFDDPPSVYSYSSLNGYYANEVYDESPETLADGGAGPLPHDVRYKTATVGSNGAVFIGAVMFKGKVFPDRMMYSMPGKYGLFPEYNIFDSPSSDGTPIVSLVSFKDKILQFKENAMYVVNISNPSQFYTEASFRDCGIENPCQAFQTPFGIIFVNKLGCFVYDGTKVVSLTNGKFNRDDLDLDDDPSIADDDANVPCIGYDPRTQSIIILKDIGDNSTNTGAWVYSMTTQSWTEGLEMITNTNADRHTNFAISPNGYLSICQDAEENLKTYNAGAAAQKFRYQTKDLDFGMPSQTKKLFKVYITYKGNASNLVATWRYNGESTERGFTATNWANDSGTNDNEVATLVPDDATEGKDWTSMSIYITSGANTVAADFEINDISILYRPRPIK